MDRSPNLSLANQLAAAQHWWRDAGVDLAFEDATTHWLKEPEPEADASAAFQPPVRIQPKAPRPRPKIGGEPEEWPQTLEAFAEWWLTSPSLETGGSRARVAPRGAKGARLMILVPEPDADDGDVLLSGRSGKLLASFLAAAGIDEAQTYIAAALPRHAPHPDWRDLAENGLSAVLLHHVELAAPERVLAFGRDILPLLGHDPAQSSGFLRKNNHQGASVPLLTERSLDFLLARPAARAGFWRRWLDWTGG